jgi:hypothetical protein
MQLNGSTGTFDINDVGELSGQTYMGNFKVKCILSPVDRLNIDKTYRELIGKDNPYMATQEVLDIAFALSQLKYRIIDFPAFWQGFPINGGHVDLNIVMSVLNQSVDAEEAFKKEHTERLKQIQQKLTEKIKKREIVPEVEEKEESEENEEEIPTLNLDEQ